MSEDHVLIRRDGAVLEIRFNRPAKKNAITNDMYGVIADALEAAASDASVRAILFTAAGDLFTAGNDLTDFAAQGSGAFTGPRHVERFLERMIEAEKPVVAAVQGDAVGVGATMLLQCDLVFIAETARLVTPFVNLGLLPENASSMTLPDRIGHVRAFQMLGLCEPLSGRDAAACGLANAALPAGEVEPRARAAAQALTKKAPESLRLTKGLMRNRPALLARMKQEGALFSERLKSAEAAEAFAAFLEKRPADFSKLG
ncbi:MAG: enoyl-CoA hydratase/isomerase family protein [Hyphomonadaceae bacterium]|nr:enoyl-CoA hydratase/isomerase family protein [Hyphomonadaceae bacterium]MBX3510457.1 enoyl-CoA hydratase/isomerase family protein [Hyphomonadaceae bacterium]